MTKLYLCFKYPTETQSIDFLKVERPILDVLQTEFRPLRKRFYVHKSNSLLKNNHQITSLSLHIHTKKVINLIQKKKRCEFTFPRLRRPLKLTNSKFIIYLSPD